MEDQPARYQLNLSRIFPAPRQALCRAFTDPGLLARWFCPAGWSMPPDQVEVDARPGGSMRYTLVSAEDPSHRMTVPAQYTAVSEGELVAWTQETDEDAGCGGQDRTLRVEFHDEPRGKTRVELRQGPYTEADEIDAREWWNIAFSHLDLLMEDPAWPR